MKAIIPVAGLGTRMRPHTYTTPKVLMNVGGKPMLDHIIDSLVDAGVTGVTLIVGYLGEAIEEHVRETYPELESHFVPQPEMLGLGHAISLGKPIHQRDRQLLIILGDTILKADFRRLLASRDTAIGVHEVEDPRRFGVVELRVDGSISRMVEKPKDPPSHKAIVGVYKVNDPALLFQGLDRLIDNNIRTAGEIQLTDALEWMIEQGHRMVPFDIDAWLDCGKPETLFATNRELLQDLPADQQEAYSRGFADCVIVPPVSLGRDCVLENSVIGPYAVIGDRCRVSRSVVADSIIGRNTTISNALLKESLIGEDARVVGQPQSLNIGDACVLESL